MQIQQYMTKQVHTVGADTDLKKAEGMMNEHHCRHLPVLRGGRLVGVLTQRDIALVEAYSKTEDIPVEEAMTQEVFIASPEQSLKHVASEMFKHKYGCAIVSSDEKTVSGIFTVTDALRVLAENLPE